MKNISRSLIFCALILSSILLYSCQSTKIDGDSLPKNYKDLYSMTTENDNLPHIEYKLEYPLFKDFPVINKEINEIVKTCKNTISSSKIDWEEQKAMNGGYAPGRYSSFLTTEKIFIDENYISIQFENYSYLGGAHGNTLIQTITYNRNTRRVITLPELTRTSLDQTADFCYNHFLSQRNIDQITDLDWLQTGTSPDPENYRVFFYDGKNAIVTFNHYQIAPYSSGIFDVTIPLKDVK